MWKLVTGILVGTGGILLALDQQDKREKEQARFRSQLDLHEARSSALGIQLTELETRFGEKNRQVRTLSEMVERLRRDDK